MPCLMLCPGILQKGSRKTSAMIFGVPGRIQAVHVCSESLMRYRLNQATNRHRP